MSAALTEEQKLAVARWVSEGANLSAVQKRLTADFSISLTYMETRFLLDDLNLAIKEAAPKPSPNAELNKAAPAAAAPAAGRGAPLGAPPAGVGRVSVSVDKIVRPGAVASGAVIFSDGMTSEWYLDQTGRLGLIPKTKGYQPKPADVQEFQVLLQDELARMGY